MRLKKANKGFTIVELVIVIAVIGVLTAILVPTFVNLTSKAKDSSDKALVQNLNTALKVGESSAEYDKPQTMHDMFVMLSGQYKIDQFVTKSGNDLLYSLEENKFYLSNDEKVISETNKYNFWKIYDTVPAYGEQTYSIYLNNTTLDSEIRVQVGIDLGENTSVPSVLYEREATGIQKVTIRTAGNPLIIDAENDEIYHHGSSERVTIRHVSSSSYFAFADTDFINIASGRIVVEKEAELSTIYVSGNGVTIAQADGARLPNIIRNEDVTSVKIQTSDVDGIKKTESTITIDGEDMSSTGNVSDTILNPVKASLATPCEEDESEIAARNECKLRIAGDEEFEYFESLQEAVDSHFGTRKAVEI